MKANSAGFTLTEVLLATALAMIMLFGTLYGSGESFVLIHEGDAKVNTHLQARRVLDRFMKDCRYSTALIIEGNPGHAWMVWKWLPPPSVPRLIASPVCRPRAPPAACHYHHPTAATDHRWVLRIPFLDI